MVETLKELAFKCKASGAGFATFHRLASQQPTIYMEKGYQQTNLRELASQCMSFSEFHNRAEMQREESEDSDSFTAKLRRYAKSESLAWSEA